MAGVEQEVANWVNQLKAMLSGTEGAADVARSAVQALLAAISANQVATFGGNNNFTGENKFHGVTEIDNLQGPARQALFNYTDNKFNGLTSQLNSITGRLANVLRTDSAWTRDYTLGGCLSRANNGNDFALSKFHIMQNVNLILGRGDVKVDNDKTLMNHKSIFHGPLITLMWQLHRCITLKGMLYHVLILIVRSSISVLKASATKLNDLVL
ncbi:hypothetical protein [Limosilactobacillus reuteri]|uniref:hypothetical protein n=1 Tax=Limosilactobacillus reuteri TaxID=1598 RepID=UPI0026025E89|nr:hypothetical protein [Limosilactobacillus reuteri]MDN4486507.1 hypothetical protein [Limosilactobacillus reuteri]